MSDILIRKIDPAAKEALRQRAARRGRSLEADLREALERLAREEAQSPDDQAPFGTWLHALTRPGADLDEALETIRSAPLRPAVFE